MKNWSLARRELLRTLGVAWLPLLRAGRASAATPPRRLLCVAQTGGYVQGTWKPSVGPLSATLPTASAPLAPLRNDVIFLPDLTDPAYPAGRTGHGAYSTMFWGLPEVRGTGEYRQPGGKTVDQVVADQLGEGVRPSLALAVQIDRPPSPGGLTARRCFWRGRGAPVTPETDPWVTFTELFAGAGTDPAQVQRVLGERKSLLDYMGKSLERFKTSVGRDDAAAIEAHLQAVRALEKELPLTIGSACGGGPGPAADARAPASYPLVLAAQLELAVAALRCGVTRVVTLQLSDANGMNVASDFVSGVPAGTTWYDLGRHPVQGGFNHKANLDRWCMEQLAGLLTRLAGVLDVDARLLDHCAVLWANHMDDAQTQNAQRLPWILAGSSGHFKTGQCAASAGQPIGGVLTALCQALGLPGDPFGPPLPGLRA
jgi:hypothetical protein